MVENIRDATQTIGTTAVQVALQTSPGHRTALAITNTSTAGQTISLGFGKVAVAGSGIVLYPGGSWSESIDGVFVPSDKDLWIISSAAGATIGIHERVTGEF